MFDLEINGAPCRVLRDCAATMDVVHPSYVKPEHMNGKVAWIKQVVEEEESVCLPMAEICIRGPFGELRTEAAVSSNLPVSYPYLFSNRSEELLRERGLSLENCGYGVVQALTRAKARELATQLCYDESKVTPTVHSEGENVGNSGDAEPAVSDHEVVSGGRDSSNPPTVAGAGNEDADEEGITVALVEEVANENSDICTDLSGFEGRHFCRQLTRASVSSLS